MTEETLWAFFRRASIWIKLRLMGLFLIAGIIPVGAGVLIYHILTVPKIAERDLQALLESRKKEEPVVPSDVFVHAYELKNVSVAVTDKQKKRMAYAQFSLVLDCPTRDSKREMELNRAKLLDTIFEVASQYYLEDFLNPTGFESLKGSLKASYRVLFKENAPRDLALRDWIMN